MRLVGLMLTLLGVAAVTTRVQGQPFFSMAPSLEEPSSLRGGYVRVRFQPVGGEAERVFYRAPAFGLKYARQDFSAYLLYGPSTEASEHHRLVEAAFEVRNPITLLREDYLWWALALGMEGGYRAVSQQVDDIPTFQAVSLLFGIGPTLRLQQGPVQVVSWARYALGVSSRPFSNQVGNADQAEVAVRVHILNLRFPYGLSLGYAYRRQTWTITTSVFTRGTQAEDGTYRGRFHMFSLGINWH